MKFKFIWFLLAQYSEQDDYKQKSFISVLIVILTKR